MPKQKPQAAYIACDGWEFLWTELEMFAVKKLYRSGAKLTEIAEEINRPAREVLMLLIDLLENDKLEEGHKLFRMVG